MDEQLIFGVSDFVTYLNQTLEIAYPYVTIEGELANLRVSKNRWVYFDLKDEDSSVKFFGTVYALPGPLEDGMVVRVSGNPRLHNLYGFSVNVQSITPVGEGALRRAADLLAAKLQAEGLFAPERKRSLPYPPQRIALITAGESAAYVDFLKILNARWRGIAVDHYDVQVQGEPAVGQIVAAIAAANASVAHPTNLRNAPKITGFAVASKKRNRDFHQLFRSVPDDDYLIEDYSCALQREILAHGRLYVSEGHLCFSSNIFGWVTTLVMSFDEIVSVEK